ncbi:MAG: methyltransferase domain-containing protein, partial [Planctomycetota bacterium]
TKMHFKKESFDQVLCLDVVEHLDFDQQIAAISEIYRVLRPGGKALLTIPNLAHFASRCTFFTMGKLFRTSTIDRHPGDRPIREYIDLCKQAGFSLDSRRGLFPTLPLISVATYLAPSMVVPMHRVYNSIVRVPGICFLNMLELRKDSDGPTILPMSDAA